MNGTSAGNIHGIILFPDSYTHPAGVSSLSNINTALGFDSSGNSLTLAEWTMMEAAGAVFIPCAGFRTEAAVSRANQYIRYWTNATNGDSARSVYYNNGATITHNSKFARFYGCAVRLARNVK